MAMITGTHDVASTLATANQSVASFGIDKVAAALAAQRAAHNRIVREDLMGSLVDVTTERLRVSGMAATGTMMEVDEYGLAPTQKQPTPTTVGIPLKLYQWPIGWTAKWMEIKTPADLALQQAGAFEAHLSVLQREIKKAFYLTGNYTHVDKLIDRVSLPVKRLYNADSAVIPNGPNNETFDGTTHTHYAAESTSALTAASLTALILNVIEHGVRGPVIVAIAAADEAAMRALTGFVAATDAELIQSTSTLRTAAGLDMFDPNNRMIGKFGAARVWVKPWAIANYVVAYDSDPANKPLSLRQREQASLQGFQLVATNTNHPLTADVFEAEFGVGVWNRGKMAVLYTAGTTYTDPTIT
jgi:hypothetical protein